MKESKYTRDNHKDFFYPLNRLQAAPDRSYFRKEEIDLADKLARDYNLPHDSTLRLIFYAEKALELALKIEQTFNVNDLSGLFHFEAEPEPIRKVSFECDKMSFTITNPYLIDRLYQVAYEAMNIVLSELEEHKNEDFSPAGTLGPYIYQNRIFINGPKRPSGPIIKSIGTEIFNALRGYKLSKWKADCILAQILSIYKIGLRVGEPLMTEQEHSNDNSPHRKKESYLTYCRGQGKNYHY